ncbi:MAG: hypothetical protein IPL61_03700 [Myxococcales bacterium]|nr:hypothetical protein [Myxococcales bacterium]
MSSISHRVIAVLVFGLAAVAAAPIARADVACSIVEIEATVTDRPSVDPDLKALERKLKKPPFSSWNAFKRLGATSLTLAPAKVGEAQLVHGKLGVMLRDVSERGGKRPRLAMAVTLDDAAGRRVVDTKINVDAGDWFMLGRSLPGNKGHLIALNCK